MLEKGMLGRSVRDLSRVLGCHNSYVSPENTISPTPWLNRAMFGLCLALIALQAADGFSTHSALATGLAEEKNELLLTMARTLGWPVIETVFAAKILTGGFFGVAVLKTKATLPVVVALALLTAYMLRIVAMNFYWALQL